MSAIGSSHPDGPAPPVPVLFHFTGLFPRTARPSRSPGRRFPLKLNRIPAVLLAAQFALAAPTLARADEGMWMPQQFRTGRSPQGHGVHRRSEVVRRPHRTAHGRDRVARRMYRLLRLARWSDRDQPPLRHWPAPVQLHSPAATCCRMDTSRRRAMKNSPVVPPPGCS